MRLADAAMRRVVNPVVVAILRSPLHAALSRHVLLVEAPGRRTGRLRRTPVNFRWEDGTLVVRTLRRRQWWRNLTPGRAVRLLLAGRSLLAGVELVLADEHVVVRLTPVAPFGPSPAGPDRGQGCGFPAAGRGRRADVDGPGPRHAQAMSHHLPRPC